MAACSGDDTGIEVILEPEMEVIPEPEPMEEVIPEPELEPVVETIDVPTLESWGIEDGLLEIVDGNCNLPILRKVAFPHDVKTDTYKITSESGALGGPVCRDSDPEESVVDLNEGCITIPSLGYILVQCHTEDECKWEEENRPNIDECQVSDHDFGEGTGYTNFYDDVFRRSTFYINTRGYERNYLPPLSFIMVQTRNGGSLSRPSGDAGAGKLYGKYNPDSGEYKDRKALWDACGVGTDPEIGSAKGDKRNGINGEWQAIKRNGYTEVCVRLDTLPGAIKCFVDDPDGPYIELYTKGNSSKRVDTDEISGIPGTIFGNFQANNLCELFDEG